jgi:regulator of cell morphogenesis and NO signaling
MSPDLTQRASALIEHIITRFHEGHRRALPPLLALAGQVEAQGVATGLTRELRAVGEALEQHMFKEEMRLFPMMEQGGNTLIGRLIEDLHREHVDHEAAMGGFRARLQGIAAGYGAEPSIKELMEGVDALATELAAHIRAEDCGLFPLFATPPDLATAPVISSLT